MNTYLPVAQFGFNRPTRSAFLLHSYTICNWHVKTGGTEELAAVVNHLTSVVKHKRLIGVGFSMGGNILIKYLGEEPSRQALFECAVSVCQGYDILR